MSTLLMGLATAVLAVMIVALYRLYKGPFDADRMVSLQLLGTLSVAVLALLSAALDNPFYIDVAVVLALLAAVAAAGFATRAWQR